jgi:hypothetical protein
MELNVPGARFLPKGRSAPVFTANAGEGSRNRTRDDLIARRPWV